MEIVDISDVETQLSRFVDMAVAGEDVLVGRNGKPLVRITRLETPKKRIVFGLLKGTLTVPVDFDAQLPEDIWAVFERR